jgi:DNA repair photolyase
MEYIKAAAVLGSPIQFSTKSAISKTVCQQLAEWSVTYGCAINALVTITTMKHAEDLEPSAPSVETRLETIRNLSAAGLSVFIFMRPLLPGQGWSCCQHGFTVSCPASKEMSLKADENT